MRKTRTAFVGLGLAAVLSAAICGPAAAAQTKPATTSVQRHELFIRRHQSEGLSVCERHWSARQLCR